MKPNQEIYAKLPWWIGVHKYYQVGETFTGNRWRLCYDDTFIADFDHEPKMDECMDALIKWWSS